MLFQNREDAGRRLARSLSHYAQRPDLLVLALPRGGVPVAFEVARELGAPLDVFLVRKLGVPGQEELAMGAITGGGVRVLNEDVVRQLDLSDEEISQVASREAGELKRRERLYRKGMPPLDVRGRTVLLVDDGLATGSTMRAALTALRPMGPARIVVAVPVAAATVADEFLQEVDEFVCLATPEAFMAVGTWYYDFRQTSDAEVLDLLDQARQGFPTASPPA